MNFSYDLILLINQELSKLGLIGPNEKKIRQEFKTSELSQIKQLIVTNADDLTGMENLPNLEKLVIQSLDYTKINEFVDLNFHSGMNRIKDFSMISGLTSLKELYIINDINIQSLDVTKLSKLKVLEIVNNPNLELLTGIDQLKHLKKIIVFGNHIKNSINIRQYIANTFEAQSEINVLDIDLYTNIVKEDPELAEFMSVEFLIGRTYLKFAEASGMFDLTLIAPVQLKEMYKNFRAYFKRKNVQEYTEYEKIQLAYNYVVRKIKMNYEVLKTREYLYHNFMNSLGEIPTIMKKNFTSLHNSYLAYLTKSANCEGHVNLMHFMLNMLGIDSRNIHCIDRRSKEYFPNHAIIRVEYEGKWYYCDPTYNKPKSDELFLIPYEKISEFHELNAYENKLRNESESHELHYGRNIKKSKT